MKLHEKITADTWVKGRAIDDDGQRMCLALWLYDSTAYAAVVEAIRLLFPDRLSPDLYVSGFNDHPETTIDDVLRVCKLADV